MAFTQGSKALAADVNSLIKEIQTMQTKYKVTSASVTDMTAGSKMTATASNTGFNQNPVAHMRARFSALSTTYLSKKSGSVTAANVKNPDYSLSGTLDAITNPTTGTKSLAVDFSRIKARVDYINTNFNVYYNYSDYYNYYNYSVYGNYYDYSQYSQYSQYKNAYYHDYYDDNWA